MTDYDRGYEDGATAVYDQLEEQANELIRLREWEETAMRRIDELKRYRNTAEENTAALYSKIATLEAENASLRAEKERYREALRKLYKATNRPIHDDDVWLPALENARDTLEAENARLREELAEANDDFTVTMREENARLREELMAQTNRAVAMNDDNTSLRDQLNDAEAHVAALLDESREWQAELAELREGTTYSFEEREQHRKALHAMEQKYLNAMTELTRLRERQPKDWER